MINQINEEYFWCKGEWVYIYVSREIFKNGRIHGGVVYNRYSERPYNDKKTKQQQHSDNEEINGQEEEFERYMDINSNALNMNYNDEREKGQ